MQKGRILILCGALLAGVAILFPVVAFRSGGAVSGVDTWAWLAVIGLGIAGIVAMAGDRRERLAGLSAVSASAAIAFGLVAAGAVIIDGLLATRSSTGATYATAGTGMWLLAAAGCIATVGLVVGLSRRIG